MFQVNVDQIFIAPCKQLSVTKHRPKNRVKTFDECARRWTNCQWRDLDLVWILERLKRTPSHSKKVEFDAAA